LPPRMQIFAVGFCFLNLNTLKSLIWPDLNKNEIFRGIRYNLSEYGIHCYA
jgi:hypothetical protein